MQVAKSSASAPGRIRIAVEALDVISRNGVVRLIEAGAKMTQAGAPVQVLPTAQLRQADIIVVVAPRLTGNALRRLRDVRQTSAAPFVLILDHLADGNWLAAADVGVAGVMWRAEVTSEGFVDLLRTVAQGGGALPAPVQGQLLKDVAALQRTVLGPRGLTMSGLENREVEVLRWLAEGLELAEIADRMKYSERTVKNILYAMMTRQKFRNRAHAVAFAMRTGII